LEEVKVMQLVQLEGKQKREVKVTPVYFKNQHATKPVVANIGGADSSKSYSIAQLMIGKFCDEHNKTFLTARKTLPSLKLTAYKLVIDLLKDYDRYKYLKHNKSDHTLYYAPLNNLWVFASIDDPDKFKSTEFNYEWLEEANDFTWEDFVILKLRMRAKTTDGNPNRMFLSFNPADEQGWINQRLFKEPYVEKIHSTYLDNPFAQEEDIEMIEGLQEQDESYWRIYARGEYARLKGLIHQLHEVARLPEAEEVIYGLDYGYTNPSTLIEVGINMEKMELYLREVIYETHLTNAQLIDRMKDEIPEEHRQREIYADSAEPDRIEEMYYAGFNIHPSDKGKKSVANGIDLVNRFKLFSTAEAVNVNREMTRYKRKVDRAGHVLEEPVKFDDHVPNAIRYAAYTHLRDRLLALEPAWTVHAGQRGEKDKEKQAPGVDKATTVPVVAERPEPNPDGSSEAQGSEKKPEKKGGDDGSWVV